MSVVVHPSAPTCCRHCGVSPTGAWNRSWEEWLLQVPSLTCDLGKSRTLFLLRQLNRDVPSLSTSKAICFEKQSP